METIGYLHLCLLYEQNNDAQTVAIPPFANTMTAMLAASIASTALLTNHIPVEARHLIYRCPRQEPIFAPSVPPSYSTLRLGSQGAQVREIQVQLRNWGFPLNPRTPLAVDGVFGTQTQKAVREFQTYKQLTSDGIVGSVTRTALFTPR
ncbi:MAG: peptidoglycan-binding domain-containing protein [Leptolyngbyaceae cyanobacterium bins.302]|nr:peptidoglycan-binding domain-containing protein [Leptolyngbyaceae cyanobacterium bins.302]